MLRSSGLRKRTLRSWRCDVTSLSHYGCL
jgi:hypothetical protein